ncbi:MAG: rod shape-determining protein [Clostridiales bacterium]|nr:rod shape-determining protein [Clostridiales bacterium]
MLGHDIGIDLGTATILVYIKGKGIVLKEPSVVAIDRKHNKVLAVGEEARRMVGRTPGSIVAVRPLQDGVISDYEVTEKMIKYFVGKASKNSYFKPRVIICVPSGVTEVEEMAVEEAAKALGFKETRWIQAGGVITTHGGPAAFGLAGFTRK